MIRHRIALFTENFLLWEFPRSRDLIEFLDGSAPSQQGREGVRICRLAYVLQGPQSRSRGTNGPASKAEVKSVPEIEAWEVERMTRSSLPNFFATSIAAGKLDSE